jgi:ParB family chromosome partitioning protein
VTQNVTTTGQDHTIAAENPDGSLTVIAQVEHHDLDQDVAAPEPDVEFAHLDPRTLVVDANVRKTVVLDAAFLGSIRQYGVLQPIVVVRQADGELRVRMGQRRTLGTIEVGRATIPARIMNAGPGVERLIFQMIENEQRTGITDGERVAAYEEMALDFGLSAGQIAGRLGAKKSAVTAALRVAKSTSTRQAVAAGLTIDQAAMIAPFDNDPEVVTSLTRTALTNPGRLAHEVQVIRDNIAEERARARFVQDLTDNGVTVLPERPDWNDPAVVAVHRLRDADGQTISDADHAACPGHAAVVLKTYWQDDYTVSAYCTDYAANGHQMPAPSVTSAAQPTATSEEKTAERRAVIAGNKAWKSATTVRRDWLRTFAARRTAPKGAMQFLSRAIIADTDDLDRAAKTGHVLALDLLGLTAQHGGWGGSGGRSTLTEAITTATPGRAQIIATTVALAAIEDRTGNHTWRNGGLGVTAYLRAIESWGYTLADIEVQAITGQAPNTEPADDDLTDDDLTDEADQPHQVDQDEATADGGDDPLDLDEYDNHDD